MIHGMSASIAERATSMISCCVLSVAHHYEEAPAQGCELTYAGRSALEQIASEIARTRTHARRERVLIAPHRGELEGE